MKSTPLWLALLCLVAGVYEASAQSGKIVGRVTDGNTGEGLPGVNVFIDGTTQGTSTAVDGRYIIIGVRPGVHTLVASFVGYASQRQQGVQVSVDLTTTIDFRLSEEVFEGQEVVVTAEVIAVKKDLTSSEARVTAETIDKLPVNELDQILDVQAGVTTRGGLHIRGGRSSEVLFMVDGVPVSDSYDGSVSFEIEKDGVQELQVISGTFNAEYGNAMSGIINVVTKEGRSRQIGGSFEAYGGSYAVGGKGGEAYLTGTSVDDFRNPATGVQYADVDPYAYLDFDPGHFRSYKFSLDGPLFSERLTFYALARLFENDGWFYGARLFNMDGTPGDGELFPMDTYEKLSWQANLKYRLSSAFNLSLITLGTNEERREYDFSRRWSPDGRPLITDDGYDAKVRLTHLVSPTAFYTIDVATFHRKLQGRLFEDANDPRYNDFDFNPPDSVLSGGGRFARGGTWLGRGQRTTRSYMLKSDFEAQLGHHHQTKIGFLARMDQLDFEAFGLIPATDPETGAVIEPFVPAIPPVNSSLYNSFRDVEPVSLSAYVQDKIEFDSFIVNAGLRLDYFDARSFSPADPEDPNIFNPFKLANRFRDANGDGVISDAEQVAANQLTVAEREAYWWSDTSTKLQLSPRLGVAYPITEQGVIHFSFGLFFQTPTLDNLFDGFGWKIPGLSGRYGPFGNPNLDPQRTTMYEIGFKQGFNDFVFDVTAYYRDVRDWVSTSTVITTALPGVNYVVFANKDYANTTGVTATLKKQLSGNYGFDLSYTYQVVEGSNSNPADAFFAEQAQQQPALSLLPLDWDQTHKLAGAVYGNYRNLDSSLRFRFASGFPYTPSFPTAAVTGNDVQPEFAENSRRIPSTSEVDWSLGYNLTFAGLDSKIFFDVFNVFDKRNATNVYSDTGEPDLTLEEFRQGSVDPGFWVRPEFFAEPRRVQMGIEFKF